MAGSTITVPVAQFAQQLRQKYPQYSSVPDDKLVAAFVAKNPKFTANYDDITLVNVSYEPATAAAFAQKPGVTDLVTPTRASVAGTGASQMAAAAPATALHNSGSGLVAQQVSGAVVKAAESTVVSPVGSSVSTPGAGVAAQAAPVPAPPVTEAPYLGNTVVVNVPAVAGPPMVGKYEVVDELGRGGMGIVYKAFDPGIGRTVALKVMSDQLARDTEFRERFLREARGAGILQHPNIVTVHELGEWQGAPFIAMEFLQGRSLEDILKNEKTMPLQKRLDIVAQVCRGLDYAHARGIVHRDIKPANVMVTTDGVAKVVDFGIARLANQKLTNTGHVLGTVSYMSPEQLQGKTLDGRSDIFAVGVMLFEAMTSVLPFAAEDTGAAITNTLYRQPPSLSNFLANYPKELDDIVSKCLAKEPGERFQTAGELADKLTQVQQELQQSQAAPTIIRSTPLPNDGCVYPFPTPSLPQQGLPKTRRNIIVAGAIMLLILVSFFGVRMFRSRSHPSEITDISDLRKRANSGDAASQLQLGRAYASGKGVDRNYSEAAEWFRKSAEQGNSHGQANLGRLYAEGLGVKQDHAEAYKWFRKAAEQGDPAGQCYLGVQYEFGRGVTQDITEAAQWYRKSAEQNFAFAQLSLGNLYAGGKGVPYDDSEAVRWYRKAADHGDATAQYALAGMYKQGKGVTQDYSEAVNWYRKSADQGFGDAQVNLGSMFQTGRGVTQDYAEAARWYRKAAEQGKPIGQFDLGIMYLNGTGMAQDYTEAAGWFRKAADQGYAAAQFDMGSLCAQGLGVAQNYTEAVQWYRKAADQGYADAQVNLGELYESGHGVSRNYAEAAFWYRKAADQGNTVAQENLKHPQRDGRMR
jgi:hypothetical protein